MSISAKIYLGDSRVMAEVEAAGIDLVVTSPPYWQIKDYGVSGQLGYGQSLHEYLKDLYRTWRECFRVIRERARLCINVGDQFARAGPAHPESLQSFSTSRGLTEIFSVAIVSLSNNH